MSHPYHETCDLIDDVFNKKNTGIREITGVSLLKRVFKRCGEFHKHLNVYIDDDSLPKKRKDALKHLKRMMRKDQEYSAFLRWAVLDSSHLKEILEEFID